MRVGHVHVVRERLKVLQTRSAQVRHPVRIHSVHAAIGAAPVPVVLLDEPFRRRHYVPAQRQPIEVCDGELAAGFQYADCFSDRSRPIEPVPALAGCDDVGAVTGNARRLGRRLDEFSVTCFARSKSFACASIRGSGSRPITIQPRIAKRRANVPVPVPRRCRSPRRPCRN